MIKSEFLVGLCAVEGYYFDGILFVCIYADNLFVRCVKNFRNLFGDDVFGSFSVFIKVIFLDEVNAKLIVKFA